MSATETTLEAPTNVNPELHELSIEAKVDGLKAVIKAVHIAMVTTRNLDGSLRSRAMTPSFSHADAQLSLRFISNNTSHKFQEIEHDAHVNASFFDEKTTNWASFAGIARVTQDKESIKQYWNPAAASNFGNLNDGVHTGDENDPRVSLIEVVPDEIRYWIANTGHGGLGRTLSFAFSSVAGKARHPHGELRTITKSEIQIGPESHKHIESSQL